jgi:hypothetical protein
MSNTSDDSGQNGYKGQTKKIKIKAARQTRGKQLNKARNKSIHPKKSRKRSKAKAKDTKQEQKPNLTHTQHFFVGTLLPLRASPHPLQQLR